MDKVHKVISEKPYIVKKGDDITTILAKCPVAKERFFEQFQCPSGIKLKMRYDDLEYETEPGDTLASISRKNGNFPVEQILQQNPKKLIQVGRRIDWNDFLDPQPLTQKKRVQLARNAAPRISMQQLDAFQKRLATRRSYLENYQKLQTCSLSGNDKSTLFTMIIKDESSPLSSLERRNFLNSLQDADIQQRLIERLVPSFANIARSMFPLLADSMTLCTATPLSLQGVTIEKRKSLAGDYNFSIEDTAISYLMHHMKTDKSLEKDQQTLLTHAIEEFSKERNVATFVQKLKKAPESLGHMGETLLYLLTEIANPKEPPSFYGIDTENN